MAMMDTLTVEELALLDEITAETIEPVTPPPAVKHQILEVVRSLAHSRTIRANEGRWFAQPIPGVDVKPLSIDEERGIVTILMRIAPGAAFPQHDHHGAEECFVVSGSARIGPVELFAGDFHHADPGSHHGSVISDEGCVLLLVVDKDDYMAA
jgi:anti-sigma factor ChrR (cupin superfamily)